MPIYKEKLIILRGNSGSGKTTIAQKLQASAEHKTALVSQDTIRRTILKEKETEGTNNIDLIQLTVEFALARGYNVILEGIFYFPRYGSMLEQLLAQCPDYYVYYLDISFVETLRRHATKSNAQEFGEKEMREWYKPNQITNVKGEKIIPESFSVEQTVNMILTDTRL